MNTIHKSGIILYLRRHRAKEMSDALLVFNVYLKIPHKGYAAVRPNAFFAPAEFTGFHISFHNIYAVFLIKRDARYLIKTNNIILAHQTPLTGTHVYEHPGHSCLAAGYQMRIRGNLLKKMAFSCSTRPQLAKVIIPFNKRHHSQKEGIFCPF